MVPTTSKATVGYPQPSIVVGYPPTGVGYQPYYPPGTAAPVVTPPYGGTSATAGGAWPPGYSQTSTTNQGWPPGAQPAASPNSPYNSNPYSGSGGKPSYTGSNPNTYGNNPPYTGSNPTSSYQPSTGNNPYGSNSNSNNNNPYANTNYYGSINTNTGGGYNYSSPTMSRDNSASNLPYGNTGGNGPYNPPVSPTPPGYPSGYPPTSNTSTSSSYSSYTSSSYSNPYSANPYSANPYGGGYTSSGSTYATNQNQSGWPPGSAPQTQNTSSQGSSGYLGPGSNVNYNPNAAVNNSQQPQHHNYQQQQQQQQQQSEYDRRMAEQQRAEQVAREDAFKKANTEEAAQKAAIEALHRKELVDAQRQMFMHQIEMDRISKEAEEAKQELDRKQKEMQSAEAKRQADELLKQQRAAQEAEQRNRQIQRERAAAEEARLREEQHKLDERQRQFSTQMKSQDDQQKAELAAREQARLAESQQLQQSFYASVLDITKIVATTNQRIVKLITINFSQISDPQSVEKSFLKDLLDHMTKTVSRLRSMIVDNVLNVDDNVHGSVSEEIQTMTNVTKSLVGFCNRLIADDIANDQEIMNMNENERISSAKKRATAVTYSIKSIIDILEKMKVGESAAGSSGTKVLSAESVQEATKNVEANIQQKEGERAQVLAALGVAEKKPIILDMTFDASKINLSSYNLDKVIAVQTLIRKWSIRYHFRQLVENMINSKDGAAIKHRKKVLFEILSTEASYFQSMDVVMNFFYKPMQIEASKPNGIINRVDLAQLFVTIEQIWVFSKKLLAEFDARLQKWPGVQLFADIFLDYADEMMVYSDFINGFDNAMVVHKRLSTNPKFVAFEQECMKATGKRLDLPSLLIMPVQRMPRYELLLKELISYSTPDHIDFSNLKDAKSKVGEVCNAINKKKQEFDNKIAVSKISGEISGLPNGDSFLDASKRLFISSSFVYLEGDSKHWTKAYLFNNIIVFAKAKNEKAPPPYAYFESYNLSDIGVMMRKGHKKSFVMWDNSGTRKLERILHLEDELTNTRMFKDMKEACDTASLQSMLAADLDAGGASLQQQQGVPATGDSIVGNPSNRLSSIAALKPNGLVILSATYGAVSEEMTVDVTLLLQRMVQAEGGKSLHLAEHSKAKLPGWVDPAKGKKKQLIIVYSLNGPPQTKTYHDNVAIVIQ